MSNTNAPKKRRWYHNLKDAFTMTTRVYRWMPWVMLAITVVLLGASIAVGVITGHWIYWPLMGVSTILIVNLTLLTVLSRKAMYRMLEGHAGAAYHILSQVKRGWVIEQEPVAANTNQDLVWRIIGRPGVVLIGEGNHGRLQRLLKDEKRRTSRILGKVPVHTVQCGIHPEQVPLAKLLKTVNKLPKQLTKHEVPAIANRLQAMQKKSLPIPKGMDPAKMKINRRALRG